MLALTNAIVSSTFSLFDFAKQMVDVSQPRKGVAFSTRSGAGAGRVATYSAFLFAKLFLCAYFGKEKADERL
jgi:hypothetical protein